MDKIKDYILKHREDFSKSSINDQLKNSGYNSNEIENSWEKINPQKKDENLNLNPTFNDFVKQSKNLYFGKIDEGVEYLRKLSIKDIVIYSWIILIIPTIINFFIKIQKTNLPFTWEISGIIYGIMTIPVSLIIGYYVFGGFYNWILKIFGGNGDSKETGKFTIIIYTITSMISLIGIIISFLISKSNQDLELLIVLITLGITWLINIYMQTLVFSKIQNLSKVKTLFALLIPPIIIGIIFIIMLIIFFPREFFYILSIFK